MPVNPKHEFHELGGEVLLFEGIGGIDGEEGFGYRIADWGSGSLKRNV